MIPLKVWVICQDWQKKTEFFFNGPTYRAGDRVSILYNHESYRSPFYLKKGIVLDVDYNGCWVLIKEGLAAKAVIKFCDKDLNWLHEYRSMFVSEEDARKCLVGEAERRKRERFEVRMPILLRLVGDLVGREWNDVFRGLKANEDEYLRETWASLSICGKDVRDVARIDQQHLHLIWEKANSQS